MKKTELHAQLVQIIARDAEAQKNAIPDDAPDRMERQAAINDERNEMYKALHRYLWSKGKKNACIGCGYYEIFADWLCDTDEERLPILQDYLMDKKRRRNNERTERR